MYGVEISEEVCFHDFFHMFDGFFFDGDACCYARIVEQDINFSEFFDSFLDSFVDCIRFCDVDREAQDVSVSDVRDVSCDCYDIVSSVEEFFCQLVAYAS